MTQTETRPMTAVDVRAVLRTYWRPDQYLTLEEVGEDSMRQGRKIDMLVVSIWKSRGHYLDAVEIKVSLSDWKAELAKPEKADFWWNHTNRFWLAVPTALAPKVKDTLPEGWGLLSVGDKVKITVQAATRPKCTPMPWTTVIGAMRGASGAGANALLRARTEGIDEGYKRGKADAERNAGDSFYKSQAEEASKQLKAFCEGAGVTPADLRYDAGAAGRLWRAVRDLRIDPIRKADNLDQSAATLERHAKDLRALGAALLDTERPESVDSGDGS